VDGVYGTGERALEAQRRMPVPDLAPQASGLAAAPTGPSMGGAAPAPGPTSPADRLTAAMALLGRMSPGRSLEAPSERPGEPLTAGMALGPGPGPEVLRPGDRATQSLRMLASFSDDPGLAELADLAERMGR
jgi:hypothetical protein